MKLYVGFRFGGLDKICAMPHFSSSMAAGSFGLFYGWRLVNGLATRLADLPALIRAVESLRVVTTDSRPTKQDQENLAAWAEAAKIVPPTGHTWREQLTHTLILDRLAFLDAGVIIDHSHVLHGFYRNGKPRKPSPQGYFCYLINLDAHVLEVYFKGQGTLRGPAVDESAFRDPGGRYPHTQARRLTELYLAGDIVAAWETLRPFIANTLTRLGYHSPWTEISYREGLNTNVIFQPTTDLVVTQWNPDEPPR